jgi:signal peptidase II
MRPNQLLWKRLFAIAWTIWLIDLATKVWALNTLSARSPVKLIGDFLQLTLIKNSGAAFSLGESVTFIFTLIAIAAVVVIAYFAPKITSTGWMVVLGLALGGILGNLTDRIFRSPGFFAGHVIDWIQIPNWPVFNLADSAIVVAAVVAVILSIRNISPIGGTNVT